jgi:hypothetical protein
MLVSKEVPTQAKWMTKNERTTWFAYNRRADLVLEPTGQQSAKIYPSDAPGARIVWQRPEPTLKSVESASKPAAHVEMTSANRSGS